MNYHSYSQVFNLLLFKSLGSYTFSQTVRSNLTCIQAADWIKLMNACRVPFYKHLKHFIIDSTVYKTRMWQIKFMQDFSQWPQEKRQLGRTSHRC
jgi:hypothetical protein